MKQRQQVRTVFAFIKLIFTEEFFDDFNLIQLEIIGKVVHTYLDEADIKLDECKDESLPKGTSHHPCYAGFLHQV